MPLASLVALWSFTTAISFQEARNLLRSDQFQRTVVLPVQATVDALQKERRLSAWYVGAGKGADGAALRAQRAATDRTRRIVQENVEQGRARNSTKTRVRQRLDELVRSLGRLSVVRGAVDEHRADRDKVVADYTGIVDAGFAVFQQVSPDDGRITSDARTLASIGRTHEFLAREDAVLSGALAAGRLSAAERDQFAQLVGARRLLSEDATAGLNETDVARYRALHASTEAVRLRKLEDAVVAGPAKARAPRAPGTAGAPGTSVGPVSNIGVQAADWRASADAVQRDLFAFEDQVLKGITERAQGIAIGVFVRLGIAGGLGLLAVVLSSVLAWRVARRLVRECRTLASGVVDFATRQLPRLADRVRSGEEPAVSGPDPVFRLREIQQISDSFTRTRDAVLVAAAGEIAARRGLSEVFVNLARRNQALLHRQLSLLDAMERRIDDPSELADLFRLDHLATRMRRHAEGLVILAGKSAGRGWRKPVPLVDVVRGAVAEVEDYPRVRVQPLPRIALRGSAVADVIHLLAELVENATTFSPPQSPVLVSGHAVGHGYVIEIEDRGLGMDEQQVRDANAKLADAPEFDPADSAQLGLFVVARLAERHDVRVTLRPSPYGGTTAIVLIPASLIVADADAEPAPRRAATGPMKVLAGPQSPALPVEAGAGAGEGPVRLVADLAVETVPAEPVPDEAPAPAPASAEQAEPGPPELTADGLPRRRRQANLAPELRERVDARLAAENGQRAGDRPGGGTGGHAVPARPAPMMPLAAPTPPAPAAPPAAGPAPADPTRTDPGTRSPEELRSMMSAMQAGWQRGRHESGQDGAGRDEQSRSHPDHQEDDQR
ncbi:sensor histidine kinase [Actinomadura parmotrematis]|uniref:sensor histidine kinase n=1 Tax=Actinomadura parmotrematis TaxID=2864039 RepID=UPI0027E39BC7|nr:nitrate- and nitrite sensing domain-containing protein [Actinomadura parmotrematis]